MTGSKRQLMSAAEIARALGVDRSAVSQWRSRSYDPPFPAPDETAGSRQIPYWDVERLPEIRQWRKEVFGEKGQTS